jgi:hypothetical protein
LFVIEDLTSQNAKKYFYVTLIYKKFLYLFNKLVSDSRGFIADALRGRPLPRCGSIRSASTPIDSKNFLSAIGQPRFTQDISLSPKTLSGPRSKRSL